MNSEARCRCAGVAVTAFLLLTVVGTAADDSKSGEPGSVYGAYAGSPVTITAPLLKVVSLNLAHGRKDALNQFLLGADDIRGNLREIGFLLHRLSPQIAALQEADGPSLWSGRFDHVAYLSEHSGMRFHASARHSATPISRFGTAIITNVPMQNVRSVRFESSPPTLRKGFLMASVPWNPDGRLDRPVQVTLVSVHLDFSRQSVRQQQSELLIKILSETDGPLVLSGDLNAGWSGGDPTVRTLAHTLGLRPFEPHSDALGTYGASGKRLDWILISSDLHFESYITVPDVLSDHLAVSATIALDHPAGP